MKVKVFALSAVLSVLAAPVFATELLVTEGEAVAKSGMRTVSLDIVSDGAVSGFSFLLRTSDAKMGSIDASKCFAALPKSFEGECRQGKEGIYFYALGRGKDALPGGAVALGQITIPSDVVLVGIENFAAADKEGNALQASGSIAK